MTADGYIKILDRKKDMINRAGYKVYSAEVEDVLAHHPQIGEAAVVAEPDPVLGEKMQGIVEKVLATPKDVAAKAKGLLE